MIINLIYGSYKKNKTIKKNKWFGNAGPFVLFVFFKKMTAFLLILLLCGCGIDRDLGESSGNVADGTIIESSESVADGTIIESSESVEKGDLEEDMAFVEKGDTEEDIANDEDGLSDTNGESLISIVMVGDLLIHRSVYESGISDDGTKNYDHLFKNIRSDVESADLAVINNEVIYGGNDKGYSDYPEFNVPTEIGNAVYGAGFDVILHASNHAFDQGAEGIENCLKFWESSHPDVEILGIHDSEEGAKGIFIYEKNGLKIAMLNYTYGLNGKSLPEDKSYMIDLMDEASKDKIRDDIRRAREAADAVIVFPHWGTEYSFEVDESEKEWARFFADEGVLLVIGSHPHVVEPIEWIEGRDGNKMLCYYSVGNYISAQTNADAMLGLMAEVKIGRNKDGKAVIADYGYEALVTHISAEPGEFTTYKFPDYTDALASENVICRYDDRFSLQFLKELEGIVR